MSHIAVDLLAQRLADPDEGINAIIELGDFPIREGDEGPPGVHVYNELDSPWVARRKFPQPTDVPDAEPQLPCVVVFKVTLSDLMGVAATATDVRYTQGTVVLGIQLLLHEADTHIGARHAMYLTRAIRGVLHRFNDPAVLQDRTYLGTQLLEAIAVQEANLNAFPEDSVMAAGSLLVTYSYNETVPLT